MLKNYVCPHCCASEFSEHPDGGLVCAYCGSVLEMGAPSKSEEALRDMEERTNAFAQDMGKWKRKLACHCVIAFFAMLFAGFLLEWVDSTLGALVILACGAYSFTAPAFLAPKKPLNPVTSEKRRIVLNYLVAYAFLFLAYWGGLFTAAIIVTLF